MPNAKTYRLVPKGQLKEALKAAGLHGLELSVTEVGAQKVLRIVPRIPQGKYCMPFANANCRGAIHFRKTYAIQPRGKIR